jgi:anaerobic ribonucleoside-triphosphate reductase activating protein
LNYSEHHIVLAEIPGEVSLSFSVTGCGMCCRGCHSPELQISSNGSPLTPELLKSLIEENKGFITCVLFLGGDWEPLELLPLLDIVKQSKLKSALYTSRTGVSSRLKERLDYIKTGAYIERLGGLQSPTTNQRLIEVSTNTDLTHKFWRK